MNILLFFRNNENSIDTKGPLVQHPNKKAFSAFTMILSLIIIVIIGLLIPNKFWSNTGSKSFSQLRIKKTDPVNKSIPGVLKWKEPFQYKEKEKTKKENFLLNKLRKKENQ